MERKRFIQLTSLAAVGAACNPLGVMSGHGKRVVVIGAGISGIAAARGLKERGFEVIVLEARDRIGGRVYTSSELGDPLDFGASWIHEARGNPIKKLAQKYEVETKTTDYESIVLFNFNGQPIKTVDIPGQYKNAREILRRATRISNRQNRDVSLGWAIRQVEKEDGIQVDDFFNWFRSTEEMDYGVDFDEASAWGDRERGYGGEDELFPNGYHQIIENLASGLGIRLGQKVKEIKYGEERCNVLTSDADIVCDHVIVTVPLGVLKANSIEFTPALPNDKEKAIQEMGMGLMNKVALKFDKVFWKNETDYLGHVGKEKGEYPTFINWAHYTGKPYLLATVPYTFSRKIEEWTNERIRMDVMRVIRKMYPSAPDPIGFAFSRWGKDPLANGAYSFLPVGVTGATYDILARRIGNLHFAGEHTMRRYSATVHGAYLSGIRVAEEV